MTEDEWLSCTDPYAMLEWMQGSGNANRRKLGPIFAACCTRIPRSIAVEKSQRTECADWDENACDPIALTDARFHLSRAVAEAIRAIGSDKCEHAAITTLVRDIIGPLPFRPVAIDTSCLTPTVLAIAQTIYNERSFDRLPILAHVLQEAGCTNPDILAHCRGPALHVRGCWVIDRLLGKE
jgi:hypothetical protein